MYLALYDSLSNIFCNELALQDTKIQNQVPHLLRYILLCITTCDGIIVKNFMSNLTTLETALCESNWGIMHNQTILETSWSALRVWQKCNHAITIGGKTYAYPEKYNVLELLCSVLDLVQDLKYHNDCDLGPKKEKKQPKFKVPKEASLKSVLASFQAKFDSEIEELKSLFKVSSNYQTNNNKRPTSLSYHCYDDQWTTSESFGSALEFDDFVDGKKQKDHGNVVSTNGTTWRWCDNCSRMGNHSTSYCKKHWSSNKKSRTGTQFPLSRNHVTQTLQFHLILSSPLNSLMTLVWMGNQIHPLFHYKWGGQTRFVQSSLWPPQHHLKEWAGRQHWW